MNVEEQQQHIEHLELLRESGAAQLRTLDARLELARAQLHEHHVESRLFDEPERPRDTYGFER